MWFPQPQHPPPILPKPMAIPTPCTYGVAVDGSSIYLFNYRMYIMINMFKQFFLMLSTLFTAAENLASSANNLAEWADESTAAIRDQAREARKQALVKAEAKTALASAKAQAQIEA